MLAFRAIEQYLAGGRTTEAGEGIAISVAAMAVTLALLIWQRHVIRRTGSLAITTDHVHYQSDLLLNLAVIVALVLDQYLGIAGSDPILGLLIAAWLGWGAWGASQRAIGMPACSVWITVSTAPSMFAKEQVAADIASGTAYRRTVTSVMMPSVPSAPTNRRVRS